MVSNTCKLCVNWTHLYFEQGECSKINDKIDVEIGDGGYVRTIETPSDFGCNLWEQSRNLK